MALCVEHLSGGRSRPFVGYQINSNPMARLSVAIQWMSKVIRRRRSRISGQNWNNMVCRTNFRDRFQGTRLVQANIWHDNNDDVIDRVETMAYSTFLPV